MSNRRSSVQEQKAAGRPVHLIATAAKTEAKPFAYFGCAQHTPAREFTAGVVLATEPTTDGYRRTVEAPGYKLAVHQEDYVAVTTVCRTCGSGLASRDPIQGTGKIGICMTCGRERR